MQTTRATLQALQQRAHEAEEMRLQEQQRQREQLLEYKDGLRRLLGKLREEYDQDMAALKQVQAEEQKLEYEHNLTMVEVADLSELEEALAKLEEEQAMLQKERQRLMASAPRSRLNSRVPRASRPSVAHKPGTPRAV